MLRMGVVNYRENFVSKVVICYENLHNASILHEVSQKERNEQSEVHKNEEW